MNSFLFGFLLGVSASLILGAVIGILVTSYREHQHRTGEWDAHLNELWDATARDNRLAQTDSGRSAFGVYRTNTRIDP